jgi:hypothetical protein
MPRPPPRFRATTDGYEAAIINFRFLASDLWSTGEAAERLAELK